MQDVKKAYKALGKTSFYDGMITCSTVLGKLVCRLVWGMNSTLTYEYQSRAVSGIQNDFSGKLLEVPVGTGILTMPLYKNLNKADITCLDYSAEMMNNAKMRAEDMDVHNVNFVCGDVGNLPFEDSSFDIVLSLNGFHAFPDKEAAFRETFRVLKKDGIFCGCFYIKGENERTDWFINHIYTPKGFFTPPFETKDSLKTRLEAMYSDTEISAIKSMVCFKCRK